MPYILNTPAQVKEMLKTIGESSIEELFSHLPSEIKMGETWNFARGLSENELKQAVSSCAEKNRPVSQYNSFLGAGSYSHYLPSALGAILSRPEFYTAYTPYQPECSQGILQAIYEFQSYICLLTGMDVSNASLYDGATSAAEAVFMSFRVNNRKKALLAGNIHPGYMAVIKTYLSGSGYEKKKYLLPLSG